MIVILPILNVTLGLVVIIFDGRWRNTERGGEHIREFNQLVWQNVTLTSYFFLPQLKQAAAARAAARKQTGTGKRNWKRDLNYLLSGQSRNSRPGGKKNILSAPDCDSIQPIRPEWLLSSAVIVIIPLIFGSMKDGIRKVGKAKIEKLPDGDKGKPKEGTYEVKQIN